MHTFSLELLALPSLLIFVASLAIGWIATRAPLMSVFAALIKAGFFLIYFGYFFDGTFSFIDDMSYFRRGVILAEQGIGFETLLHNWALVVATSGDHFVFYLFNSLAINIFGPYYFSPVALTILLTPLICWLGAILARREFDFDRGRFVLFFFYFFLFPDTLVWSSLVNGKDTLVLLLHVVALFGVSQLIRGRYLSGALIGGMSALVLFSLRFYVPLLFGMAWFVSFFLGMSRQRIVRATVFGAVMLGGALAAIGPSMLAFAYSRLQGSLSNPLYGFIRFLLTPIPLHTEANYVFLDLPATFHWLMLPVGVLGFFCIARRNDRFSKFFVIYFLTFVSLYALYTELQEPRHRVQLDYCWAVFHFAGLLRLAAIGSRSGAKSNALPLPLSDGTI